MNSINVAQNFIIRRGDMYWVDLKEGRGSIQGGKRPAIIIQNHIGNKYSPTVIIAVITSQQSKKDIPTHVQLKNELGLEKDSVVLTEQVFTINKLELLGYIGKVRKHTLEKIDEAISISVGIKDSRDVEDIKMQVEEVKYLERRIRDAKFEGETSTKISQLALKFEYEYRKLENMCSISRKYVTDFYKVYEHEEFITNTKPSLRVVAN